MCGRFTLTTTAADLEEAFPGVEGFEGLAPRYNIAPSQPVAVIANTGENRVELYRWGLIPSWARDPGIGNRLINARGESLSEKPSFRVVYKRRRCLVVADGFYEWRAQPGGRVKIPMFVRLMSSRPFAFAGLWDEWRTPEGEPLRTCTIVTTTPNALMQMIHNRMPVILGPTAHALWLDSGEQRAERLDALLRPYAAEEMTAYPVSRFVNSPQNDSPACIVPSGSQDGPGA
jgi:putative SOS response-associated peptidase YedK